MSRQCNDGRKRHALLEDQKIKQEKDEAANYHFQRYCGLAYHLSCLSRNAFCTDSRENLKASWIFFLAILNSIIYYNYQNALPNFLCSAICEDCCTTLRHDYLCLTYRLRASYLQKDPKRNKPMMTSHQAPSNRKGKTSIVEGSVTW